MVVRPRILAQGGVWPAWLAGWGAGGEWRCVRTDTESFSVNFAAVSPPEPASSSSTSARVRGRSMPANSGQDRAHAPADQYTGSYHPRCTSATRGWAGNSGCCRSCAEWRVLGHRLRLLLGHPRSASRCSCSRV
jgi:hypothetical protein